MRLRITALLLLISASVFSALPKPAKVDVSSLGPNPVFRWDQVEGAAMYRVAVFAAPDEEGKRELMGAVWIKGLSWPYGNSKVIPKAGKLPSTPPKALDPGMIYKVMVSAADSNGMNKSDWASAEFHAPMAKGDARTALKETSSFTMTPTPAAENLSGTATPTPAPQTDANSNTGPAELEVDLAGEFKETPEAGEVGLTKTAAPATLEGARALLQSGKAEAAEAAYKALLDKDATNADSWEGLGDSYDARKMKVEAKEAYEKALAIDGKRERLTKWMDENVKR